jgi:hypothetical protein
MLHDCGIQVNGSFVLGFDHDRKDVFARHGRMGGGKPIGVRHVSHPHAVPGNALFRQMESEKRLLHRGLDSLRHRPRRFPAQAHGSRRIGTRLRLDLRPAFLALIHLARRPEDWSAVPLYLAMSYLYKRSNRFWHQLIKHDLVHGVWRPLVEMTRLRHLQFRRRLAEGRAWGEPSAKVISAGV